MIDISLILFLRIEVIVSILHLNNYDQGSVRAADSVVTE